ncbi:t-SNARE [Dimargaris cristalligena]|uniref:t-SNARE n=1 Tax=Dimargaris cristalligena TaxID=215637 RepID=A0A4Q0A2S0_9FUNG|nr:t-SNARE [Dimargaris cristalligena]|eukprot:RKP40415.1 t-SNARE [Dimargaris cristalligena]
MSSEAYGVVNRRGRLGAKISANPASNGCSTASDVSWLGSPELALGDSLSSLHHQSSSTLHCRSTPSLNSVVQLVPMATRNRTFLFVQYRNSFGHAHRKRRAKAIGTSPGGIQGRGRSGTVNSISSERDGLIGEGSTLVPSSGNDPMALDASDVIIEMATLPPKWVDIVDEINEKFQQIRNDMKYLSSLHKKHLLPGFDDRREDEDMIEDLTNSITKQFHEAQELIRYIVQPSAEGQEVTVGNNIRVAMASKLQTISSDFRKSQSDYLDKVRNLRKRNHDMFALDTSTSIDPSQERSFNFDLTDEQIATMKDNDEAITEREREIDEIAKSITTVAEIFKEMQTMVIDQGTLLDRIDYNVEQVVVHVKKANEELDEVGH